MVSSNDHVTFCYMFDMLLYCVIIVRCEGVFSYNVQFQGYKCTQNNPVKCCFWQHDDLMNESMGGVIIMRFSMVKRVT